jgi:hypothetical protein
LFFENQDTDKDKTVIAEAITGPLLCEKIAMLTMTTPESTSSVRSKNRIFGAKLIKATPIAHSISRVDAA